VKTFKIAGKRVETRLFVRHTDGGWAGYSYEWNAAGTDATLLDTEKTKTVGTQTWTYPSRGQCMSCHQPGSGFTLGLETAQMNRDEGGENQLARLGRLGVFATGVSFTGAPRMPSYDEASASAESKARAYLHANCSFCHRPDGLGRGAIDLRFARSFDDTGLCNVDPENGTLGVASAKIFAPGAPDRSVLSLRLSATDDRRMPPLASRVVDPTGTALVSAWIRGTTRCP
jgi:mono/diheme cytochrome c family protein